jgi:myo-inositol-1-phosphate synthase
MNPCLVLLTNCHDNTRYTKSGIQQPNYFGSLLRTSTVHIGANPSMGKEIHVLVSDVLLMVSSAKQRITWCF